MPRKRNPIPSYLPHSQTGRAWAVWTDQVGRRRFQGMAEEESQVDELGGAGMPFGEARQGLIHGKEVIATGIYGEIGID